MAKRKVYPQSGVIPFRRKEGELQVLLVTSRSGRNWVIPKGLIEDHLTPLHSAEKEALEEAGIVGTAFDTIIGSYDYKKWKGICRVDVYPMLVEELHDNWEEDFRKRKWFSVRKASKRASRKGLRKLIAALPEALEELDIR